jgi:hypothetical protein
LRILPPVKSIPLMRVCAVNGTMSPAQLSGREKPRSAARSTIDLPSGVGSLSDESAAARTSSASVTPVRAANSRACRFP